MAPAEELRAAGRDLAAELRHLLSVAYEALAFHGETGEPLLWADAGEPVAHALELLREGRADD